MKRLTAVQTISPKRTIPTAVLINEFKSILVHPALEPSPVALEAISILKRPIVLKIDADETRMMIGHIAILFKTAVVMAGVRAPKTVLVWESEDKPPTVRIYCLPDDTPGKPIFDAAFRYWNSQTRVIKNGSTIDAVMIPKPDEIRSARFKFAIHRFKSKNIIRL